MSAKEVGRIFVWNGSELWTLLRFSRSKFKNLKPIAVDVLYKVYPMVPLSGWSIVHYVYFCVTQSYLHPYVSSPLPWGSASSFSFSYLRPLCLLRLPPYQLSDPPLHLSSCCPPPLWMSSFPPWAASGPLWLSTVQPVSSCWPRRWVQRWSNLLQIPFQHN